MPQWISFLPRFEFDSKYRIQVVKVYLFIYLQVCVDMVSIRIGGIEGNPHDCSAHGNQFLFLSFSHSFLCQLGNLIVKEAFYWLTQAPARKN